jgi:hypothetical protein
MAAHLVAPLVLFLLSAGDGATSPWLAAAAKGETVIAGVYADLPAICAASDPLIDALADSRPNSAILIRLAAVADAVCAAAKKPNNPIDQAQLVIAAIEALSKADHAVGVAVPASVETGPRLRGRSL